MKKLPEIRYYIMEPYVFALCVLSTVQIVELAFILKILKGVWFIWQ